MNTNPRARDILILLGATGFLAGSILLPGLPLVLKPFIKKQYQKWGHFDKRRLRMELKRLQKTGVIQETSEDGEVTFILTDKGKAKLLRYKLEKMKLRDKVWDGKWRIIAYDIPKYKKNQAEAFRSLIKRMGFYQLQKSVWLTPYKCSEEIEFLKNLYSLSDHITLLTLSKLEGEAVYKKYFGL